MKQHHYQLTLNWKDANRCGTTSYKAYSRDHQVSKSALTNIQLSSDPYFRGNPDKFNPEELLVSSLSSCHLLWYLHLCAENKIVVLEYNDNPEGWMVEEFDGGGQFKEVILRPEILIEGKEVSALAHSLHEEAHKKCFISRSCNFPVKIEAIIKCF